VNDPVSLDDLRQTSRQVLVIYQAMLRAQALDAEGQDILRRADELLRQAGLAYLMGAPPAPALPANDHAAPPFAMASAYTDIQRGYAGLLEALYALGVKAGQVEDWALAEPIFAALMSLEPTLRDAAAWHERAVVFGAVQHALAAGDLRAAGAAWQTWLKKHPGDRETVAARQRSFLHSLIAWVDVPAGEFLYGDQKQRLSLGAFRMSRTPITNAQYNVYVQWTGASAPGHWVNGSIPAGKDNHPVVNVSWDDAQAFCGWAGLRLPTEQQWEKAARGVDGRAYPWGNQPPSGDLCNFNNIVGGTTPVGQYPKGASPYGLLDMAGNSGSGAKQPIHKARTWSGAARTTTMPRGWGAPPATGATRTSGMWTSVFELCSPSCWAAGRWRLWSLESAGSLARWLGPERRPRTRHAPGEASAGARPPQAAKFFRKNLICFYADASDPKRREADYEWGSCRY